MAAPSAGKNPRTAYIALGSNLGDKLAYLHSAIAGLRQLGDVTAISSIYETAPVGLVSQPDFLNAVVELQSRLEPAALLAALLRIEQQHGRDRSASPPKGPRTLDLDLLAYDHLVLITPALTLPHPSLAERRFVLAPLVEIAPDWRHPTLGKTAADLLEKLEKADDCADTPAVRKISTPPKFS